LNEAKDNVKYLQTLERFIEPLYDGNPITIKETLPVLMNSIKMIHTVARYYNTDERMTGLFVKITNQMILNCKQYILTFKEGTAVD
jgi:dynein heavy chain